MNIKTTMLQGLSYLGQNSLRVVLVFGALLVVPFVALSSSASAAYSCPSNAVCVYEHQQGGGERTYWGGTWSGTCLNMISSWNDRISSIQNNMPKAATFYEDSNCTSSPGWTVTANPGDSCTALSHSSGNYCFAWYMNDEISSVYFH